MTNNQVHRNMKAAIGEYNWPDHGQALVTLVVKSCLNVFWCSNVIFAGHR